MAARVPRCFANKTSKRLLSQRTVFEPGLPDTIVSAFLIAITVWILRVRKILLLILGKVPARFGNYAKLAESELEFLIGLMPGGVFT